MANGMSPLPISPRTANSIRSEYAPVQANLSEELRFLNGHICHSFFPRGCQVPCLTLCISAVFAEELPQPGTVPQGPLQGHAGGAEAEDQGRARPSGARAQDATSDVKPSGWEICISPSGCILAGVGSVSCAYPGVCFVGFSFSYKPAQSTLALLFGPRQAVSIRLFLHRSLLPREESVGSEKRQVDQDSSPSTGRSLQPPTLIPFQYRCFWGIIHAIQTRAAHGEPRAQASRTSRGDGPRAAAGDDSADARKKGCGGWFPDQFSYPSVCFRAQKLPNPRNRLSKYRNVNRVGIMATCRRTAISLTLEKRWQGPSFPAAPFSLPRSAPPRSLSAACCF